jgi:amino acid transporter
MNEKPKDSPRDVAPPLQLRRTLTLWDLILYGVVVIQPVAPMSVFGVLSERGQGHVVTAILIAMVAMLFTGISYGRMARDYPSAGSAFTYVAQEINPAVGYVISSGARVLAVAQSAETSGGKKI